MVIGVIACTNSAPVPFAPTGAKRAAGGLVGAATDAGGSSRSMRDSGHAEPRPIDMDAAAPPLRADSAAAKTTDDAALPQIDDGTSGTISAAQGGTLCLPSGRACLKFAPGALAKDEIVTFRRVPSPYEVPDWGLRIEPETLVFKIAPELRIDVTTIPVPVPYVTHVVNGYAPDSPPPTFRWNGSGSTRREDQWLVVAVPQPGFCAVEFDAVRVPNGCALRPGGFTPCGGNLEGHWQLEGLCYAKSYTIMYETWQYTDPCPVRHSGTDSWAMDADLQITGSHMQQSKAQAIVPLRTRFDLTCRWETAHDCAELASNIHWGAEDVWCSGSSTSCDCRYVPPTDLPAIDTDITTNTSTLQIGAAPAEPYCVEGSRLRILKNANADPYVIQFVRIP
jgi:hypothetical protein